jgi:ketosteroid isomerase-like protein
MKGTWVGVGLGLALAAAGLSAEAASNASRHDRQAADVRAIIEGERAWSRTYVTADVAAIRQLLADGFRGVDPHGAVYDKAAVIRDAQRRPHRTSGEVGSVTVSFNGDTAVARAREHDVGPAPERQAVEREFTDTWRRTEGRWRLVAADDLGPAPAATAAAEGAYAKEVYAEDRQAILALRQANNRALAAHDLDGAMSIAADDYVVTGGDGGIDRSMAENRKAWAAEFARSGHDRYVRTPAEIEVGASKGVLRAAESGTWEGLDQKPAGAARPFGRYFAHWSKASGRWRVVSESYVTLGCRGVGC